MPLPWDTNLNVACWLDAMQEVELVSALKTHNKGLNWVRTLLMKTTRKQSKDKHCLPVALS